MTRSCAEQEDAAIMEVKLWGQSSRRIQDGARSILYCEKSPEKRRLKRIALTRLEIGS